MIRRITMTWWVDTINWLIPWLANAVTSTNPMWNLKQWNWVTTKTGILFKADANNSASINLWEWVEWVWASSDVQYSLWAGDALVVDYSSLELLNTFFAAGNSWDTLYVICR